MVEIAYYSSIGRRRVNEDCLFAQCYEDFFVAIVADGMGGMGNGETASQAAVSVMEQMLSGKVPNETTLRTAAEKANQAVIQLQNGSGTTLSIIWGNEKNVLALHVGDSRIYQFRDGKIIYQSTDHSVSQLAVQIGEITKEQIRGHRARNRLTRALGVEIPVLPELCELCAQPGDRFLVCSDGFWEPVTEEMMLAASSECSHAKEWLDKMRLTALEKAKDNHTAVAVIIS